MRYFVVVPGPPAYVLAEVVREDNDDGRFRESSPAAAIAGPNAFVATDEELLSSQQGRELLTLWRLAIDRAFDEESDRLSAEMDAIEAGMYRMGSHLTLVEGGRSSEPDRLAALKERAAQVYRDSEQLRDRNSATRDRAREVLNKIAQSRSRARSTTEEGVPR